MGQSCSGSRSSSDASLKALENLPRGFRVGRRGDRCHRGASKYVGILRYVDCGRN